MNSLTPGAVELVAGLPRWYQIAQHLRATIAGRAPDAPDRLPTEEELAGHYRVSVMTVRQALRSLQEDGLVVRQRRRGTFVHPDAPAVRPLVLRGPVDAVVAQQSGQQVEILERALVPVPAALRDRYPDLVDVVFVRRLRSVDGVPTSVADNWVHPEPAARISDDDLLGAPMTQALRDRAGVHIGRIENVLSAEPADPGLAALLDVAPLSPVLHCAAHVHDADGRLVDVAAIRYRADRFHYAVTLDTADRTPAQHP